MTDWPHSTYPRWLAPTLFERAVSLMLEACGPALGRLLWINGRAMP